MRTLPLPELAAVSGGSLDFPAGLELPAVSDPRAIEDFLAWWFQQTVLP